MSSTPYWVPMGADTTVRYFGTTPPANPQDGDLWYFPADTTNGIIWQFRYRASSASAYKWEFVGGTDAWHAVPTVESTTTTGAWLDLATVGPIIAITRAGDYDAFGEAEGYQSGTQSVIRVGVAVGAATPLDQKSATTPATANFDTAIGAVSARFLAVAGGSDIRLRYNNNNAGTANWRNRWLRVRPVRVS